MTPVVEYIKNVGKSVVYTTTKQLEMDMPATKEFMESNEELFKDTYHSLTNLRRTKNRIVNAIKKSTIYDLVDYSFDNIVDSFKTGKFNDPYRESKAMSDSFDDFESGDNDMSMSNFGDSDSSIDENTKAVLNSSASNASSISTATFESAKYIAGVSKANTALLFNQTVQMNQTLSAGFSGLNAGIDSINKFNTEIIQNLADNATKYFQTTTDILKENNAMFKEFLEMQRNLYKAQDNSNNKSHDLEDVLGANGTPNLKAYGKMVLKNIKTSLTEEVPFLDTFFENPEMIKSMLANPLSAIPGMMISAAMGPMLKTSLKHLDETIGGIFGSFLSKMSFDAENDDENSPWYKKVLGKIFGVQYLGKSSIDTTNKQNGATPFDFQTKRAITEVIPGYLARIEAGILGGSPKIYNDKTGKWTNIATIKQDFKNQQEYAKTSGSNQVNWEMNRNMESAKFDEHIIKLMNKVMDKVAKQRYEDNGRLETFGGDLSKFADYYGMDEGTAKLFLNLYNSTSRSARINSSGDILRAKLNNRQSLKYEENLGSQSLYRNIFTGGFDDIPDTRDMIFDRDRNGNVKKDEKGNVQMVENPTENIGGVFNLNNMSDKYGSTVFDYLRSIDINTKNISNNGGTGGIPTSSANIPPIPPSGGSGGIILPAGISGAGETRLSSGIILPAGVNTSTDSYASTTNTDKQNEIYDNDVSISGSDITYKNKIDMANELTRIGMANQLRDLKEEYKENDTNYSEGIAELLNNLDELKNAKETLPGQDKYKGKWGTELITENETLQKAIQYLGYPGAAAAAGVQSFADAIYDFLYGDLDDMFKDSHTKVTEVLTDGEITEKPKGFFQAMSYGMNNMFKRMQANVDNLDEEKRKSIWNKADAIIEGALGFKMKDVLKESKKIALKEIGSPIFDTLEEIAGVNKEQQQESQEPNSENTNERESNNQQTSSNAPTIIPEVLKNNIQNPIKNKKVPLKNILDNWIESNRQSNYLPLQNPEDIQSHADGATKVTKSGLTFLSKGEIVIPNASEKQRGLDAINEENIRQRFINQAKNAQMFSKGGKAKDDGEPEEESFIDRARGVYKGLKAKFSNETEQVDSIYDRVKEIYFGDSFKETKDAVKKVEEEIKDKVPNIAAGGLLGTAGGALIGGPLFGAVMGSALGIASNSETVQTALFGEKIVDKNGKETGERNGSGLFSREAQKTMSKYMPDMKKYGITGAALGMFTPFGLLGGALMGSTIGFLKNNESVQEALFGKDGLIDEDTHKKLKKYFPAATKGTTAGLFLGLAGGLGGVPLLGVAALGAGIGLVTTTDEFKDEVLGKMGKDGKRHGGVLEEFKKETIGPFKKFGNDMSDGFKKWFKEDIAAPVVSAIKPMGKQLSIMAKATVGFGKKLIKGIINGNTGIPLIDNIMGSKAGRLARYLGGKAAGAAKWVTKGALSAPSKLIGKFGDYLRENQIKNGQADYMSAAERKEWMAKRNIDYEGRATDEVLSNMNLDSLEEYKEVATALSQGPEHFDETIRNTKKNLGKALSQSLDGKVNNSVAKELSNLVNDGKLKEAQEYLAKLKIPKNKKAELAKMIQDAATGIKESEFKRDNFEQNKQKSFDKLSKVFGKKIDSTNIDEFNDYLTKEHKVRTKDDEESKELTEEEKLADTIAGKSDEQISELQTLNETAKAIMAILGGSIDLNAKQKRELNNYANSGKEIMDKTVGAADKLRRKRQKSMTKIFGNTLSRDTRNKIANDDTGRFTASMKRFSKTNASKYIDPNYIASLDDETRDLYNTISEQGYEIENIDVIKNLSTSKKEKLIKLVSSGIIIESIKDLVELKDEDIDTITAILKYPEMQKMPQKTLVRFAKKYGNVFLTDKKFRKETLIKVVENAKNFDGKIVEDTLHKIDKNKKSMPKVDNAEAAESAEVENQQPEDIPKHFMGGLIKSAGAAILSKGEMILKAGSKAAKNWAKNKIKEKFENSSVGRMYKKATNLKASISNALSANGESNGMTMTTGADGRKVAANTKENADIKKAEQQKNAVQQDNNDTLHQINEAIQQVVANTTPPDPKTGGGLLGTLLSLVGTFLFKKFKQAYKFIKGGWEVIEKGTKGLMTAVESIGKIGTKIAEMTGKAGEFASKLMKPFDSIGTLFKSSSGVFGKLAKIGAAMKGKTGLAALAAAGFAAYEIFKDDGKEEPKLDENGNPIPKEETPEPGTPPKLEDPNSDSNSLLGAASSLGIGGLGLYGANKVNNWLSSFGKSKNTKIAPKAPGSGMTSKLMKGFGAYAAFDTANSAYDFLTASTDDKIKMLNNWGDKSLTEQGMDLLNVATAGDFVKSMGGKALNFFKGAEPINPDQKAIDKSIARHKRKQAKINKNPIEDVSKPNKGLQWLKETGGNIADKGKNLLDKGKTLFSESKSSIAENMKTIITKASELIDNCITKISKVLSEKYAKVVYKIKDIIINKLRNPAIIKGILKSGGKALAKLGLAATGVGAIVTAGWMAVDGLLAFYDGFNNAANIFSLTGEYSPTIDIKMLAGAINAIYDASIVGPIIWDTPSEFAELCLSTVGPMLGITKESIEEDCKNQSGYIDSVVQTGKNIVDKTSEAFTAAKDFVGEKATQVWEGAKELGGAAKQTITNAIDIAYEFYEGIKNKASEVIDEFTGAITESITNITNFIGEGFNNLYKGISDGITSVITNLGNIGSSVIEWVKNSALGRGVSTVVNGAKNIYNSASNFASNAWNGAKNLASKFSNSITNSSLGKRVFGKGKWGRGSDATNVFHSQLDPENSMSFNTAGDTINQSMEDSGCGPVSAANIGSFFGKDIDSKDAANYALKNGYKEKNGGTKDGFFGDFLGKYGIGTKHINPSNAKESLKHGKPVLLMGKDDSNNPILDASGRGKTPFGSNPHYVVATGLDKNNNMIIQDPESKVPNRKFKASDVMSKSSIAMDATTGMGRWGTGNGAAIWEYLKKKGLGSSAIAGIMGNLQAESGLEPRILQDIGNGVEYSDDITVDGKRGYGLAQWTYPTRQQALKDFADSRGTKAGDLNTQLDFLLKEIDERGPELISKMDKLNPHDAAILFHDEYEGSADDADQKERRGTYATDIAKTEGKGEQFNGTYKGGSSSSGSSGGNQYGGIFGAFDRIYDAFGEILTGKKNNGPSTTGPGSSGGKTIAGGHSTDAGIKKATEWANSVTGNQGFGDNGCTEFVKQYLLKADNPVGKYMEDGSQGNLMWVPTLKDWAKENNMFKPASAGGAEGDIAITGDGDHVTIADGDGGCWGNSSSKNEIVHYDSISDYFNTPDGYVSTGSGTSKVSEGAAKRSAEEIIGDSGSTYGMGKWGRGGISNFISKAQDSWNSIKKSGERIASLWNPHLRQQNTGSILSKIDSAKPKSPSEFRKITNEDIENITNSSDAIELLKSASIPLDKIPEMNIPTDEDDLSVIKAKVRKIIQTIKPEKQSNLVDGKYEQNDIDYLVNNGYTKEDAIDLLSKDPKYTAKKTELEKKMDSKSFDLEQAKKSFDNKIKEIFNKNNTNTSQTNNTSSVQQQKVQQQSATPVVQQQNIDYSEKFDTMISLLATLVKVFTGETAQGNATGTGVVASTANNSAADIAMANARNTNAVRADELAKLFTNINNSMNALASR